jgi:hypothetical protein
MTLVQIAAKSFVTAPGFRRAFQVGTLASFCEGRSEALSVARERADRNGHDIAWTVNPGTCLVGDKALGAQLLAKEAEQFAGATVVADGQQVVIEGETFTVKVMGERFADPIHFKLVK